MHFSSSYCLFAIVTIGSVLLVTTVKATSMKMDYLPLSDVRTDPNKPGVPQWHIRWTTSSDVSIGHNVKAFVK
jgi:hypothetical protein